MIDEQFIRNFNIHEAYDFLVKKGLISFVNEIRFSRDRIGPYTTTLKRARIIEALKENKLLDEFINDIWPTGNSHQGRTRLDFWQKVYKRFDDEGDEGEGGMGLGETEPSEEEKFAAERDLHDYLKNNLVKIENGLKLYQAPDGKSGYEFVIDDKGRRIDILALDNKDAPVIVEFKVSKGHERVLGQVLYYQAKVKELLPGRRVRIIVIANEISSELILASETIDNIELFEYKLSVELTRVK